MIIGVLSIHSFISKMDMRDEHIFVTRVTGVFDLCVEILLSLIEKKGTD